MCVRKKTRETTNNAMYKFHIQQQKVNFADRRRHLCVWTITDTRTKTKGENIYLYPTETKPFKRHWQKQTKSRITHTLTKKTTQMLIYICIRMHTL